MCSIDQFKFEKKPKSIWPDSDPSIEAKNRREKEDKTLKSIHDIGVLGRGAAPKLTIT